jgi:hypothetical protein
MHLPGPLFFEPFLPLLFVRAARVACSNTSRTPSPVLALHSMYLTAPMRFRTSSPCSTLASKCFMVVNDPTRCSIVEWGKSYLLGGDRLLRCLVQLFNGFWIESQILLAANEDDGQTGAEVQDFGDPLSVKILSEFIIAIVRMTSQG